MLVYGDRVRVEDFSAKLLRLAVDLEALAGAPPGIERHGRLVALFIEASELFQGSADAEFSRRGCDAASPLQDRLMAVLVDLAGAVMRSWRSGFLTPLPELPHATLRRLAASREGPERIEVKTGEGYAFYALYPEAYAVAAEALERSRPMQVIGIRSIGAGLAAIVAAGGAGRVTTVRPVGHPFRRELALAPDLTAGLLADPAAAFAVVDEGPGLSGSSLGAVGDFFENHGVPEDRIAYFPSHAGDLGPQADPRHRARWARARRHVVDFDALVFCAENPAHRLEHWVTDLVGAPLEPLQDISAGAWRTLRYAGEDHWPAANVQQERRKYLARTESGTWLLKFVGLGRLGLRKLERARALAAAGFTPEVAGYRHGFLVERWREDARPLRAGEGDRAGLAATIARYLAFRAREFLAEPGSGASTAELLAMARHNAAEAMGGGWAAAFERLAERVAGAAAAVRRVETDNRMHRWEWLRAEDGALIKTDALDHHDAHDLIGCQDIAWDIVGAAIELDFSPVERDELRHAVERETGKAVDPDLLAFLTPCYLAFQLGFAALGAQSLAGWPQEAARLRAASETYAVRLRNVLSELS